MEHCCATLGLAERRVCRVLGQARSTQRYQREPATDEAALTQAIVELASQYGRYGYRQVTGLLRNEGWRVNHKRVERIWRHEGLKVQRYSRRVEVVGREPGQNKSWLIALPLRDWEFRKGRCHDFDNLPLIIQTDDDAFSNRQSLKQVRILYRERDRLL